MAACAMKVSAQSRLVRTRAAPAKSRSFRPVVAKLNAGNVQVQQAIAASTAFATLLTAGNANAAQEIAALSASDSRLGTISLLFVPVIGWVGFNILGPLFRQLDAMQADSPAPKSATKRATRKASIAALVGAAATMMTVQGAEAATEFAQIADSDARVGAIATLFLPALGWVAFNIFGPATRQIAQMSSEKETPSTGTKKNRRK